MTILGTTEPILTDMRTPNGLNPVFSDVAISLINYKGIVLYRDLNKYWSGNLFGPSIWACLHSAIRSYTIDLPNALFRSKKLGVKKIQKTIYQSAGPAGPGPAVCRTSKIGPKTCDGLGSELVIVI